MNQDNLLSDLTGSAVSADDLVTAARRYKRHRLLGQCAAVSLICASWWAFQPTPTPTPPPGTVEKVPTLPTTKPLTTNELLDSFGEQPVALVTFPDGTQRLLALVRHEEQ